MFPSGFLALPTTTLSCVTLETDPETTINSQTIVNTSCVNCGANSPKLALARGCVLYSSDGTTITYCSQVPNGNQPQVTSCYQGTFQSSNYNSLASTTCTPTTTSYEFCQVVY